MTRRSAEPDEYNTMLPVPTPAKLVWQTADGHIFPATSEQLASVQLVKTRAVGDRFERQLARGLGIEDDAELKGVWNTIRYMLECALHYDHDFDHGYDGGTAVQQQRIERMYAQLRAVPVAGDGT